MDKKELEVKRDFCKQQMDYWTDRYEKREAELAETEKPEPKDLDFGRDFGGQRWIRFAGVYYWIYAESMDRSGHNGAHFAHFGRTNLREVFDDLKAISGPLTWFGTGEDYIRIGCKIDHTGRLEIRRVHDGEAFFVYDLPEFILNLQRLVATRKKHDAKGKSLEKTKNE